MISLATPFQARLIQVCLRKHIRNFHIQGRNADSFLAPILENTAVISGEQNCIRSYETTKSLNVLLHADRRPKRVPAVQSTDPIRIHYGPALLGCQSSVIPRFDQTRFSRGDLGVLSLQDQSPQLVVDLPILLENGLELDKAYGFLLRMVPIAGISVTEPKQWQAAHVLQQIWNIFSTCQGIWFSFRFDFSGDGIQIYDPFLEFDDYALTRIPDELRQSLFKHVDESKFNPVSNEDGLFYIKLPHKGYIGTFGYGAGNAMATMDGITNAGGLPANFLDGGGGANKANAKRAMEILSKDNDVRSIFVNSFGGITQTDVVAEGIIEAVYDYKINIPVVVRLRGTGSERAEELLQQSDFPFVVERDFSLAARQAVKYAS